MDPEYCDTENETVLYLSADDSNSMAGPVIARQAIQMGTRVTGPIRIYEFLNYYEFDYEAAEEGTVRVSAQVRPTETDLTPEVPGDELFDLQIGVRAPDIDVAHRRPVNLTLSLDTSGSMTDWSIELVRQSCLALAHSLRAGDIISIVTWNHTQAVVLESHAVTGRNDPVLVDECEGLEADGTTDLHAGLVTASRLARENFSEDLINRVILMSDGGANTGVTDNDLIAEAANDAEGEAIYLMGVGMDVPSEYRDDLMNAVTDAGKGAYIFIDSRDEAWRMFGERFLSNIEISARNVRVELTMPPTFTMFEFHGEEYSSEPSEVEPQHLAPNDAMIYHQIIRSCDPSSLDLTSRVTVTATYETPFTREPRSETLEMNLGMLLTGVDRQLVKGNAIVAYAQALEATQRLRGPEAREALEAALAEVEAALETLGDDQDLREIRDLLTAYIERF
jgi:Ca-activated chloride channel family protein